MTKTRYFNHIQHTIGPYLPLELLFLVVNCPASIIKKKRDHIVKVILLAIVRTKIYQQHLANQYYLHKSQEAAIGSKQNHRRSKDKSSNEFLPKKKLAWQKYSKAKSSNKYYHEEQTVTSCFIDHLYPDLDFDDLITNYQCIKNLISITAKYNETDKIILEQQARQLVGLVASNKSNAGYEEITKETNSQSHLLSAYKHNVGISPLATSKPLPKDKQNLDTKTQLSEKIAAIHPGIQLMITGKVYCKRDKAVEELSLNHMVDKLLFRHKSHFNLFYNNFKMHGLLNGEKSNVGVSRMQQHMCSYLLLNIISSSAASHGLSGELSTIDGFNLLDKTCTNYLSRFNNKDGYYKLLQDFKSNYTRPRQTELDAQDNKKTLAVL